MQKIDDVPVYSASDLVGFLACEHLTALDRAALHGLVNRPHLDDPVIDVLHRRGLEHEARYLESLMHDGRSVRTIDADSQVENVGERLRAAALATVEAMGEGVDVIYQATFFDHGWRGHADFLRRVDDRPSRFGTFHYEVVDTKLARHVKPGAVLQLCSYVDQLSALQGVAPERMHVALGGSSHAVESLRVDDFLAYYRAVKQQFVAAVGPAAPEPAFPPPSSYPEPVAHCEVCRWRVKCEAQRRADDSVSFVAGITSRQRASLAARGVTTLSALGELPLPVDPPIEGVSRDALVRIREQARLQLEGRLARRHKYELLASRNEPIAPGIGLGALPEPSRGDLFLDLEGDPYALDDGIDYLFGILDAGGNYHAFWSTDDGGDVSLAGERRAFERCMDVLMDRLGSDPGMHVYHFGSYERTALGRLMGRHGTREEDVDRLLRGRVLVDLHRVVRQSLRASVESYSIKKLEPLYGFTRDVELRDAGSSIAVFEQWLELGDGERPSSGHLEQIAGYNRDDTVSTARLRDWLESLRAEAAETTRQPVPRPSVAESQPPEELGAELEEVARLADALTADVPADVSERTEAHQARWLLAQLLSWHRREDKSFWWSYFHLCNDLTDAERIEATEPLAGLQYEGVVGRVKRSLVHRYRFSPQDHEVREGRKVRDPATGGSPGTVVAVDEAAHTVDLQRGEHSAVPHPTSLIPFEHYGTVEQRRGLRRLAASVVEHGVDGAGPYRGARDLLLRRSPRVVGQAAGEPLCRPGELATDAARRLVVALDRTTLAIQGPPGSGKTYTGARMVLDLARAGKKVGVTANSHKVIANFLTAVCEAAVEAKQTVGIVQKCEEGDACEHDMVARADENANVEEALRDGSAQVVAGTVWLWARAEMAGSVDVLFVDEAGQLSLANALAAAHAAGSLVLLGDPQQLDQPRKGSHPPGAERSALWHLLGDAMTMPPEMGLFLKTTWRLHPDVCRFTSELFYESRLEPEEHLARQRVGASSSLDGTGLRFVSVVHSGNDIESPSEADTVSALARSLVDGGASWVDAKGRRRRIGWDDVLIVAPYNAQVAAIAERLPEAARVGTVDKFQGQEAPVSIYSMTSSTAQDAPRGMAFLYSGHRLNVATSRARCVAVIVASPALVAVRAGTPVQMRLANGLCRFVELAQG